MLQALRNRGESWILFFWLALPLTGQLTAPFFILSAPFFRNHGKFRPELVVFAALCAVYVGYVGAVSVAAGDLQAAIEPTGDAASLAITVGLAAWVLRYGRRISLTVLYKASALLCIAVFALTAIAHFVFDVHRPALLMLNPLNLSPALIVPALLCTFGMARLSGGWRIASVLGFFLAVTTIAVFLQARGTILVLLSLCVLRLFWIAFLESGTVSKNLVFGLVVSSLGGAGLVLGSNSEVADRFLLRTQAADVGAAETYSDESVNLRLAMLRAGWRAFLDSPVVGHGGQNRFQAARPYLPTDFEEFSHLHNDFLTHAVAGGIPAVLLLLLLLFYPVAVAWRANGERRDKIQFALLVSGAFAGTAAVNNVLFVDVSAFALGLSYVVAILMIEAA